MSGGAVEGDSGRSGGKVDGGRACENHSCDQVKRPYTLWVGMSCVAVPYFSPRAREDR